MSAVNDEFHRFKDEIERLVFLYFVTIDCHKHANNAHYLTAKDLFLKAKQIEKFSNM